MILSVLIIVYSRSGTTSKIANIIKEETGGDIFNVTSLIDYSGFKGRFISCYHQVIGNIPEIREVPDIDKYDLIYVGGPTWAFKPSGPILKLLEKVDFKNKKVIPFLACSGYYGSYFEKFAAAAKNADIIGQGAFVGIQRLNETQLREKVTDWLRTLKVAEQTTEKQKEL